MRRALKIILCAVVIIALISTVRYCADPYDTQTVTYYEYQKSVSGEGFILREETVVDNDVPGVFEPYVNEGERVGRDARIGTVISGTPDENLMRELNDVNQRIEDIEESTTIAGIYQTDTVRIANAVNENVKSMRQAVADGDLNTATELKREIGYLKNRTAQLDGSEPAEQLLSQLYSRKTEIETAIGSVQEIVYAPIAGVYSSAVDGLESYGTEEALSALTPEDIDSIDLTLNSGEKDERAVCKISDNFIWYLAAKISEEEAAGVKPGAAVNIRIDNANSPEVAGKVYYLSEPVDGSCAMVVSCDLFVEGISSLRRVDYEVVLQRETGLRIPSSALRIEDGHKGVYILIDKKTKSFRYVNDNPFRSEDDQYYIVDAKYTPVGAPTDYVPLKEYDKVLIEPEKVK